MNNITKALACAAMVGMATFATAIPVVSNVTMTQCDASRLVTITYRLTEDAVVTLDVLTNATPNAATGWASIGGEAVCNAEGAVWRKVTSADADGSGNYTITWHPDLSWTDDFGKGFKIADGCAKVVVTAYALDNTPDYMVVDISAGAQQNTQRYYPSVDFLPGSVPGQTGAITNNTAYRNSLLVMRKIMAKDVVWVMGSVNEYDRTAAEDTHQVSLTNNYYIGVFEVTQTQWSQIFSGSRKNPQYFGVSGAMRPVERVSYNEIRCAAEGSSVASGGQWPSIPYEGSFLRRLRDRTGVDFDLPSEAEWEFAARAGHGDRQWGNGAYMTTNNTSDPSLKPIARFKGNEGGTSSDSNTPPEDGGTAICGSYQPNDWGLYDMHGNVMEICLDWYEASIGDNNGRVNIDVSSPLNALSGNPGGNRVRRGGCYSHAASSCRAATRGSSIAPNSTNLATGFRLACRAGLK